MRRLWPGLLLVLLLAACGGAKTPAPELGLEPGEVSLAPGEKVELRAVLRGVEGGLRWSADRGRIEANGDRATYTAPDYPTDATVTVASTKDPRLVAVARVRVRTRGLLGPRIRITSNASLIFGRVGETHTFSVEVYDERGHPVPGAEVEFSASDPSAFAVTKTGPKTARVKALKDTVQTVRLVARYKGAEAWGQAVFAELQANARKLDPGLLLGASWDPSGRAWTEIALKRTPETEALKPGQVVFFGDRTGVWGRVVGVRLEADRVVLATEKAALPDIFKRLRYRTQTPVVRVRTEVHPGGAGFLRVMSEAGEDRLIPLGACSVSGDVEVREPYIGPVHELWVEAYVNLEFGLDPLDTAGFVLHGAAGLVADAGGVTVRAAAVDVDCPLYNDRIRIPVVSVLLMNVNVDLYPALGVYVEAAASGVRFELTGPRAEAVARIAYGFRYTDATGWRLVDDFDFSHELRGPGFDLEAALDRLRFELGPYAGLEIGVSVSIPDPVDLTLLGGRFLEFSGELPFHLNLPVGAPARADYAGPVWGFGYRLRGFIKLRLYGELAGLLTEVFGEGASDLGRAELFNLDEDRAFLHEPRVWSSFVASSPFGIVDLGSGPDPRVEFTFGTDADEDPGDTGEIWRRGGACAAASACFSGELAKIGEAAHNATLVWRPGTDDVGVWEIYARHRVDAISRVLPYSSRPPLSLVTVVAPRLKTPVPSVALRGRFDKDATGVLAYQNARTEGVLPNGTPIELTSPLRVTLDLPPGLSAETPETTVRAGAFGRHALHFACGGRTGTFSASLTLVTNDPRHPSVSVPVTAECTANHPPEAEIQKTVPADSNGDGVIEVALGQEVRIIGKPRDPDGDPMGCYMDLGDGSPPVEIPRPDCGAGGTALDVRYTYKDPGTYVVAFVVEDDLGERDVAQVEVVVAGP